MSANHYLWRVRCKTAPNSPDAFIERDSQGLPCWAQEQTEMLPLPDAERLKADAAHALGGTLYLEPAEKTFRTPLCQESCRLSIPTIFTTRGPDGAFR